ncbi:SRPBCC family protein [Flagellimonas lutimaris]|uniref:SRPBCC family protein n=1 Tax=Flagellimonas lutimaris TaxID=475082 RepID=A0A3A1NDH8_9FLAO|nr:SRPBCC family protein [Allomuricauda lutimaris]RIV36689.1 SRPBCC family protein [Allomuricauda lutimaris]
MKPNQVKISRELNVSPEQAWDVIAAVEGVDKWFGSIIKTCDVVDGKRFCTTKDGVVLEEQILEVDNETKTFRFGIPKQEMLPVENIIETIMVTNNENGKAIIDWSASIEATNENATIAKEAFLNLWAMGLEEMENFINNRNQ